MTLFLPVLQYILHNLQPFENGPVDFALYLLL